MATNGPISDRALAGLRVTAAVLAAVPMVHARVRYHDETLLEVRRPPLPEGREHPVLPPCAFHNSVARAHQGRKRGERLAFRGLPAGAEPAIDWTVAAGDLALPGSMFRCSNSGSWWHIAAVAMPLPAATAAALGAGEETVDIRFHSDPHLDVTLMHISTEAGRVRESADAVDRLQTAIARCAVAELIDHVNATAPDVPMFPA